MITKEFEKGRTNSKGTETKNLKGIFEIFSKENLGSVRTVLANDEIWFSGKDACKILGIKNHKQALERLDPEEVGMFYTPHPQSPKKEILMNFVTESGLYELIFRSNKPEAKIFKQWITKEVIPTIRKHGYYSNVPQIDERDRAKLAVVNATTEEERMIAFGIYNEKFVLPMQKELEMARPKVETYNEFLDAEGTANTTTIAKSFGLSSGRLLNEIMHFEGFIVKIGNGWGPAKKYVDARIMKPIEFSYNNQKSQSKLAETSNDKNKNVLENKEVLLIEENKTSEIIETAELAVIENENEISNIHQNKGLTFRWTLIGIEAIKEILLSKNYIIKDGNVYSANPETLKEFKKKYKEWKEKK
jgi:toxin-antitoxin system, toxin component, bro family